MHRANEYLFPSLLTFSPSPCPGHYPRHLATMASADFCFITRQVTLQGAMKPYRSVLPIICVSIEDSSPSTTAGDAWTLVSRLGPIRELLQQVSQHVKQISPDKNVNFHYTTAAFTLSPESWTLSCGADLPGDWALYAISVRRLIVLHSNFLRTVPRGSALVFG
jgi:hypothetical protein